MRLFIAEKPKMGQAIAAQLPGPHIKKDGYIETGGGLVSWCVGHILEQLMPEDYDERFAKWNIQDLPIVPAAWKLKVSDGTKKQARVLKDLLKTCTEVVNAGDPGREGQLIVDEVLEFYGNKKPVLRISLNALDAPSVQKALNSLEPNIKYATLYQAALGRQRADWMMGINLTRAYTVIGRGAGYPGVLSVGRVQTPTLNIVVQRDLEIDNFVPQNYWTVKIQFADPAQANLPFWAEWSRNGKKQEESEDEEEEEAVDASRPAWLDEKGRINDAAQAQRIAKVGMGGPAAVAEAEKKPAKEAPPPPFELTKLQAVMDARHGIPVKETLGACQSLYEKGYTSYPRTDCTYLPTSQHGDAGGVLAAVARTLADLAGHVQAADLSLQSAAWNDAKVGEHHAIIPTAQSPNLADLSPTERHVYRAVSMQFLAQFYPDCLVEKTRIVVDSGGEKFTARGRIIVKAGWRVVFGSEPEDEDDKDKKGDEKVSLPNLNQGQSITPIKEEVGAKKTTPPPRYTEGTLLLAMQHVDRFVKDPAERKKLKNIDGIGRSATRAAIIENLVNRKLMNKEKKSLISSLTARALIHVLPAQVSDPGLTARWEQALDGIAGGTVPLSMFEQRQEAWVRSLIQQAIATPLPPPPPEVVALAAKMAAARNGNSGAKRPSSAGGKAGASRSAAKPAAPAGAKACPVCKTGHMREREVRSGNNAGKKFLGCSGYPECKHSEWPK